MFFQKIGENKYSGVIRMGMINLPNKFSLELNINEIDVIATPLSLNVSSNYENSDYRFYAIDDQGRERYQFGQSSRSYSDSVGNFKNGGMKIHKDQAVTIELK